MRLDDLDKVYNISREIDGFTEVLKKLKDKPSLGINSGSRDYYIYIDCPPEALKVLIDHYTNKITESKMCLLEYGVKL